LKIFIGPAIVLRVYLEREPWLSTGDSVQSSTTHISRHTSERIISPTAVAAMVMARWCWLSFIRVGRNEKLLKYIKYYHPWSKHIFFFAPKHTGRSFFNYDKRQLCGTSQSDISRAMPMPPPPPLLQSNYLLRNWFFFFSTLVMDKSARPYTTLSFVSIYIYSYKIIVKPPAGQRVGWIYIGTWFYY